MCSSGQRDTKDLRPELPASDLDLEDPLGAIPTDLRPTFITEHDHTCPDCGGFVTDDEFRTWGGHQNHIVTPKGISSTFRSRKHLDQPPVRVITATRVDPPPKLS